MTDDEKKQINDMMAKDALIAFTDNGESGFSFNQHPPFDWKAGYAEARRALAAEQRKLAEVTLERDTVRELRDAAVDNRIAAEARVRVLEELIKRAILIYGPSKWCDDARAALDGEK